MNLHLEEKKIIITASTDGIGYAAADKFLEEGACVLLNGRNETKAAEKADFLKAKFGEGKVFLYVGDTTSENGIREMRQYAGNVLGHIDCIVANVGSGRPIGSHRLETVEWEKGFDINLFSAVKLIQEFDDMWGQQEGGSIVMISSLAACERIGAPYAYAAAKEGIRVLTKYLSDDYAVRNIRVNCVIPGNVFYHGGRWEELLNQDREGIEKYIQENVPLKRFAKPEEVADAIVFLASERAAFITGTSLLVDGGQKRGIS